MTPTFFHDPTAPVQPDQFEAEFDALLDIYRKAKPRRVLEIGVREGGSLYQWMKNTPPGAVIVAVDLPGVMWGNTNAGVCNPDLWQTWAQMFGHEFHFIWGSSHDPEIIAQIVALAPYDFAFIDGDHSALGVADDVENVLFRTRITAIHDILKDKTDPTIEVYKLWEVLKGVSHIAVSEHISEPDQGSRGIGVINWGAICLTS